MEVMEGLMVQEFEWIWMHCFIELMRVHYVMQCHTDKCHTMWIILIMETGALETGALEGEFRWIVGIVNLKLAQLSTQWSTQRKQHPRTTQGYLRSSLDSPRPRGA